MNAKETFYIIMAAIGGYAAYLAIKDRQRVAGIDDSLFSEAFNDGSVDFYYQRENQGSYNWLEGADPNKFYGL